MMTRKARHQIQQKHFKHVMYRINGMQKNSFLSDMKLKCEDKEFSVHKIILSASSPFFEEYFTTNSDSGSFEIDFMNSKTLETVLIFIYEGRINVTRELKPFLKDLVEAFRILQMPLMYNYCLQLLLDCHSPQLFLSKWNTIEELGSDLVKQTYLEYLYENLEILQTKENFLALIFEQLNVLLSIPVDKQEYKSISAILLWVKYNEVERGNRINDLLCKVDFGKLKDDELLKLMEEPLLKDNFDFHKSVANIVCRVLNKNFFQLDSAKQVKKTPIQKDAVNDQTDKYHDEVNQQKGQTKKKSSEKVQHERSNVIPQRIIAYDDDVYRGLIEYDLNSKTWVEVKDKSLLQWIVGRTGFAVCSFDNYIYFFGGAVSDGTVTNSCYLLDLLDNEFTQIPSMNFRRIKPKAVKLRHYIYVIGGFSDKKCSEFPKANERYNIFTKEWETLPLISNTMKASGPLVVVDRNFIYAVSANELFRYSFEWNEWFKVNNLPSNCNNFCPSAMIEESGKIFIFGYGTTKIFAYELENKKWKTYDLPGKELYHTDVSIFSRTDKMQFFVVGCKGCFLFAPPDSYQCISTIPFQYPKLIVIQK